MRSKVPTNRVKEKDKLHHHRKGANENSKTNPQSLKLASFHRRGSPAGPDEYPRVLDYSIYKSLLVPYSKNFTTRPSSRVVVISTFFVGIIEISTKWKSVTFVMDSCVTPNNYNNIHLPSSLNSRTVFHVVPQGLC